jgi:hypothetical protein
MRIFSMTTYKLADKPTQADHKRIGAHKPPFRLVAIKTGEFRQPRAGEWYLSGAIPEAYRAFTNFTREFHIVEIVADKAPHIKSGVDKQIRLMVNKLYYSLLDYHKGTNTTRPFEITHGRDEILLQEVKEFLTETKDI